VKFLKFRITPGKSFNDVIGIMDRFSAYCEQCLYGEAQVSIKAKFDALMHIIGIIMIDYQHKKTTGNTNIGI